MKNTTTLKGIIIILLGILLIGCSAEDGADGAIGPQGEQGPAGQDGQDGEDGNANVVSVLFENQSVVIGDNVLDIPELTQDIYDNGGIIGYVTVIGNNYWEAFPVTSGGSVILEIDRIEVGSITLRSTFDQSGLNFRFILIAGTSSSAMAGRQNIVPELKKSGINVHDYHAVIDHFGLKY